MVPSCPHCQKNLPIPSLLINAKNLTECPSCKKAITPKLNWKRGLGFGAAALLAVTFILFLLFGQSQVTSLVGGFAGLVAFMIFGYQFDKKD
ncbi:hypothetical protein [Aggregatibacter kilianii]|uniref:hypothetical protein n=1 Tax=Aggregatibacter kilianii TaxID=2025884 RepID=UPI000D6458F8|nr:hypothetical protein [Aggregatibacter kilianii]